MRQLLYKISLIVVLTFCFSRVLARESDFLRWFPFKNIRTEAGLLHPRVTAIETDSRGFIWVGTQNGLNLYDGHEFKSFIHNENDTASLSDNDISYIYKDNADNIWIGTVTGMINRYCRKTNSFIRYDLPEKPGKRKDIKKIAADGNDNLWIGYTGGLVKFNPLTGEATKYLNPDFPGTSGSLETFFIDSFGRFWVSYWDGGVYLFNAADGTYSRFTGEGLEFLNRSSVMSMTEDSRHNLWMGSYVHGLLKISHPELKVTVYSHNPLDSAGINSNHVKVVEVDEQDNIWIGTEEGGLDYFNKEDNIFYHYFSEFQGNEATEGLSIYAMKMSSDGKLWIGTRENGIFMTRTSPVPFKFIQPQNSNEKVVVTSVCEDNQGNVWAAIKGDIARVNLKTYRIEPLNLNLPESPNVIQYDGKGNIWIGGLKGGIYTYNAEKQNVEKLFFEELENRKIFSFYFSETRVLVFSGLLGAIDLATRNFEIIRVPTTTNPYAWLETGNEMLFITRTDISWFEKPKNSNLEFKFDSTLNFHFPNSKSIYATTEFLYNATDAGLYRVNRNTGKVRYFNKLPGPVNYEVNVIFQGPGDEIWFSTAYNLVRFDPDDNHFRVYDDFDGVPDIYFRDNVGCKLKNGKIIFGGDNGLVLFDPADIHISPDKPNIEFTGFSVGNIGNTQDLNIEPYRNSGNFIKLKHNQNFFNIRFALLHYVQPEKVLYRYMLEGFDTEWTEQYNSREKTYMNLPFGEYLFKVQAKNPDNQWSEIKQLGIRLNPPFWLTWYAYLTYFLIFILLLYMFRNYNIKRERLKNELELQHLKVENVEKLAQKEHELNELKLRFFTNISHEFKTPLTLIISPIEQYMETMKLPGHEIMAQVHANALRLKQLVSQVLDIRKIDQGNMDVTYAYADFIRFASGIAMRFKGLAAKKKLGFEFIAQNEHIFTRFDADKMEKILTNLLSNAIQNTFAGKITLEIGKYSDKHHNEWAEQIEIVVKDTGLGIPEDSLDKIFDRFYQVNQAKSNTGGAGIGLSLVKELVALHQGTVKAESTPGKGSRFIVCFPVIHPEKSSHSEEETEQEKMPCDLPEPDSLQDDSRKVILIAEDNQEMRNYLVNELSGEYEILEAENGEEGLEKCLKFNPDLIMSDIMMPGTDGFEFCKQVKTDERTSHIPVLLVTALSGSESQQEGYHAGADDYITKPFNITILKEKIRNFLTTREKLKQQFIRDAWSEPEILKIASGDEKFLKKAYEVIEENLSESEFDINDFAGEMATSRSQLYRKLKALTGLSASEFIKITRIKIAARLIKDKNYNVSEAAYTVGFKDPKYFSKCFQKQFGVVPSRFKDSGQPHKV